MKKIFLYPASLIYGFVVFVRNLMFDYKILKSTEFDIPIVSIGNITVGGTGKTPHTEYLIRLLKGEFKIATLSRGYKRKTSGYILADDRTTASDIGDEPMQLKSKFDDIQVAVAEKRVVGIERLLALPKEEKPDAILLDDAFQHRYVKPGINILLIDYSRPISEDYLMPLGRLRESDSNIKRSNIIIITKCPAQIKPIERRIIAKQIDLRPYQALFFTAIDYGQLTPAFGKFINYSSFYIEKSFSILLVTGIANPFLLKKHLDQFAKNVEEVHYPDHHTFSKGDIKNIAQKFEEMNGSKKIIVTTEKDVMRLREMSNIDDELKRRIFYIPLKIKFLDNEGKEFDRKIKNYVRENKSNFELHSRNNKV